MAVRVGPFFRTITGVGWKTTTDGGGEDDGEAPSHLVAGFWFQHEPFGDHITPCRPDDDLDDTQTNPGTARHFFTHCRLIPDTRFAPNNIGGLYSVREEFGMEVDFLQMAFSGLPDLSGAVALDMDMCARPAPREVLLLGLGSPDPRYPSFDKSLAVTYQYWESPWDGGFYCDWIDPLPWPLHSPPLPDGYSNSGYLTKKVGDPGPDWPGGRFMAAQMTVDLSGFSIIWPDPETTYRAKALRSYSGTEFGGRLEVLMLPSQ